MAWETITFTLGEGEGPVSAERLIRALENVISALRSIGSVLGDSGEQIEWQITEASMRSPLRMTLSPRGSRGRVAQTSRRIVREFYTGVGQIERKAVRPTNFDDETLEYIKALAPDPRAEGDAPLRILVPGKTAIEPTGKIIEHVNRVVAEVKTHHEIGTIEGRLETVTTHGGHSVHVWESFTNIKVECSVTPEQLEEAKDLLGRRVSISGTIRYRNRKPTKIEVERIKPLREMNQLPRASDLGKIDITGGMSSEDFVREGRGWNDV